MNKFYQFDSNSPSDLMKSNWRCSYAHLQRIKAYDDTDKINKGDNVLFFPLEQW